MTDDQDWVEALRWRQCSILSWPLVAQAKQSARWPANIDVCPEDWAIVLSHSCDVSNRNARNEPDVEILIARPAPPDAVRTLEAYGRNSRRLLFQGKIEAAEVKLFANAHERFAIDRRILAHAAPDQTRTLGTREAGLLIRWIAKRYVRQAFPDDFDELAKRAKKKVDEFLERHAPSIFEVFIAFAEPSPSSRYHVEFRIVVNGGAVESDWAAQQARLEEAFEGCWAQAGGIEVDATAVQDGHFSLRELAQGRFQKFDRDWISYAADPEAVLPVSI